MAIGRSSLFGRQLMLRSECADVARLQINAKTLIILVANVNRAHLLARNLKNARAKATSKLALSLLH